MAGKRRGITLFETMIVGTVLVLVSGMALQAFISLNTTNTEATALPPIQTDAIDVVNTIAAAVRRAPLCTSSTVGTVDAALVSGTANSLTVITGSGATSTAYGLDANGNFTQTISGTTTTLQAATVSLTILYYVSAT